MHVAHVNLSRELRGGEFQTAALVSALDDNRQVQHLLQTVVLRRDSRFHEFLQDWSESGKLSDNVKLKPVKPALSAAARAAVEADILHVHEGRSMKVGALVSLRGRPFVATRRIVKTPKNFFLTRWIYSRADRIACVSRDIAQAMIDYMGSDRVSVIYDCVRTNAGHARVTPAMPHEPLVVASIGTICFRDKGQDLVLEVARHFDTNPSPLQFVIAGDGVELDELRDRSRNIGNVEVAGWVDDVPALLAKSNLLLHPARVEGLGSVLLEAMASGTPVLASKVGGIPEIVEDGRNGFLVDPDSISQMVSVLERCLVHPELLKKLGVEAQRAAIRYSSAAMAEQYLALYIDVLRTNATKMR